ncbi:hypothetical protein MIR68_010078 [Amoeboaphelidium protococcarum]|nr:hypothetical protein MIR68_010078 [Amoeboaphelidium protococcarum]
MTLSSGEQSTLSHQEAIDKNLLQGDQGQLQQQPQSGNRIRLDSVDDDNEGNNQQNEDNDIYNSSGDQMQQMHTSSPIRNEIKKANHNATERARREDLNVKFSHLASAVPLLKEIKKPSKAQIIVKSLEYVKICQHLLFGSDLGNSVKFIGAVELIRQLADQMMSLRDQVVDLREALAEKEPKDDAESSSHNREENDDNTDVVDHLNECVRQFEDALMDSSDGIQMPQLDSKSMPVAIRTVTTSHSVTADQNGKRQSSSPNQVSADRIRVSKRAKSFHDSPIQNTGYQQSLQVLSRAENGPPSVPQPLPPPQYQDQSLFSSNASQYYDQIHGMNSIPSMPESLRFQELDHPYNYQSYGAQQPPQYQASAPSYTPRSHTAAPPQSHYHSVGGHSVGGSIFDGQDFVNDHYEPYFASISSSHRNGLHAPPHQSTPQQQQLQQRHSYAGKDGGQPALLNDALSILPLPVNSSSLAHENTASNEVPKSRDSILPFDELTSPEDIKGQHEEQER